MDVLSEAPAKPTDTSGVLSMHPKISLLWPHSDNQLVSVYVFTAPVGVLICYRLPLEFRGTPVVSESHPIQLDRGFTCLRLEEMTISVSYYRCRTRLPKVRLLTVCCGEIS